MNLEALCVSGQRGIIGRIIQHVRRLPWRWTRKNLHDESLYAPVLRGALQHPLTRAPCTTAPAHTSPLFSDHMCAHLTPQHWLLCHMGLYCSSSSSPLHFRPSRRPARPAPSPAPSPSRASSPKGKRWGTRVFGVGSELADGDGEDKQHSQPHPPRRLGRLKNTRPTTNTFNNN